MSTIKAVIFDRDNTLVAFDMQAVERLEAMVASAAPGLPAGILVRHWLQWPGPWPQTPAAEPAFWRSFWGVLASEHRLAATAAAALDEIGGFYHTCFRAYPDAAPCLAALRQRNLRLAVLTNFELPSVAQTLHHAGLAPELFAALLSSTAIGARKPEPPAYYAAAAALQLAPEQCLFVDDLPENVAGATAVGMRGILLDRQATQPTSESLIHSLGELPNLV